MEPLDGSTSTEIRPRVCTFVFPYTQRHARRSSQNSPNSPNSFVLHHLTKIQNPPSCSPRPAQCILQAMPAPVSPNPGARPLMRAAQLIPKKKNRRIPSPKKQTKLLEKKNASKNEAEKSIPTGTSRCQVPSFAVARSASQQLDRSVRQQQVAETTSTGKGRHVSIVDRLNTRRRGPAPTVLVREHR